MSYAAFVHLNAVIGRGSHRMLPELLSERGWARAWVVVDRNFSETAVAEQVLGSWRDEGVELHVSEGPDREPTYEWLEEIRTSGPDWGVDVMLGLGGGATIDTAKGLGVLATNSGPAISYRGFDRFGEKPLPIIAIPTIPGSGADVTPNASFVDQRTGKKLGINGEGVRPALTILDPELCLTAPHTSLVTTGFDALVHAVEAFASKRSNLIARALSREAIPLVWSALDSLRERQADTAILEDLLVGADLAALAMSNASSGPAACLSYPAGVRLEIPHGLAGALFLPEVIELNVERGAAVYASLVRGVGAPPGMEEQADPPDEAARSFASKLRALRDGLRLDRGPSLDVDEDLVALMCADLKAFEGALEANPVPFSLNDGRVLYERVFAV